MSGELQEPSKGAVLKVVGQQDLLQEAPHENKVEI